MARITTAEVCALARISRATMWRRVRAGALPRPIDYGREALFDQGQVVAALAVPQLRWRAPSASTLASETARTPGAPQLTTRRKVTARWTPDRWKDAFQA